MDWQKGRRKPLAAYSLPLLSDGHEACGSTLLCPPCYEAVSANKSSYDVALLAIFHRDEKVFHLDSFAGEA